MYHHCITRCITILSELRENLIVRCACNKTGSGILPLPGISLGGQNAVLDRCPSHTQWKFRTVDNKTGKVIKKKKEIKLPGWIVLMLHLLMFSFYNSSLCQFTHFQKSLLRDFKEFYASLWDMCFCSFKKHWVVFFSLRSWSQNSNHVLFVWYFVRTAWKHDDLQVWQPDLT